MKALAIRQPFAEHIAKGKKRIEYRSWQTHYRGPLVIIASGSLHKSSELESDKLLPRSCLVCLVDLVKITGDDGNYEWHLRNPRRLEQVRYTKSRVMTFDLEDPSIVKLAR